MFNIHQMYSYFVICITLIVAGQCRPSQKPSKTLLPTVTINPSSLSPGQVNICEDFVHTVEDNSGDEGVGKVAKQFGPKKTLENLLKEDWKRQLGKQFRKFTKKHVPCKATVKKLKKLKTEDLIEIHHRPETENITSLSQLYIQASKISLLLGVLNSAGTKQCCLQDKKLADLYLKFKNRILSNLYHTVSNAMANWRVSDCYMQAALTTNQPMRCEDVVHVITIVLKNSIDSTKTFMKTMKRVKSEF